MPLIDDWRHRHPRSSSRGRVIIYIFLLIVVILFILRADSIVRGFTRIFFSPDTTETTVE
ncbi:MAG: hypothetical protein R6U39_02560 [Candidatus Aegiribacteria sp.]